MSNVQKTFIQRFNPRTGLKEIILTDDNYDYSQQIARSGYADMLHDSERNIKYRNALEIAIDALHSVNKKAIVLDIGTGTGLLSLFAEQNGADEVYACESFKPMAKCAMNVISLNSSRPGIIKLIPKRSHELTVGIDGDLPHRANILVTEVFDTELIGEGAISTFNHAHANLLEEGAIVIPDSAQVFGLIFESELVNNWHKLHDITIDGKKPCTIKIPDDVTNCIGTNVVHDIQLSQLQPSSFKKITTPQVLFSFDFSKGGIKDVEQKTKRLKSLADGVAQGLFMWWEISMLKQRPLIISCAPSWAISSNSTAQWRDHWMQAVYYFPETLELTKNKKFILVTGHDQYSWQFRIASAQCDEEVVYNDFCQCSIHYCSRSRIGMFNDRARWSKYEKALSHLVHPNTVCVCLSENTLLGVYIGLLGAKAVYQLDMARAFDYGFKRIIQENNLTSVIRWASTPKEMRNMSMAAGHSVSLIVSDPYFEASLLPMHNLMSWYYIQELDDINVSRDRIIPTRAQLFIMPVQFDDLWKIRAPVNEVLGINLKPFDTIIQNSVKYCEEQLDAQPLWEYPCKALAQPKLCMEFNLTGVLPKDNIKTDGFQQFETDGECNGIVVWMEWILSKNPPIVISTGPVEEVTVGQYVTWDMYSKQGVYFTNPVWHAVTPHRYYFNIIFRPDVGTFEYEFDTSLC